MDFIVVTNMWIFVNNNVVTNKTDSISAQQVNTMDLFVTTLDTSVLTICTTK